MKVTRRQVLAGGAVAGITLLGLAASRCSGPVRTAANQDFMRTPVDPNSGDVFLGWSRSTSMDELCRKAVAAVDDLSWLERGDSVFVKVSCNSPQAHPAVTSPDAVRAMVALLKERGAGRVIVGDQSGVQHVRLTASSRKSSTREAMAQNGLLAAIESTAELHCFDDAGYDGYFAPDASFSNHWNGQLRLANVIQEVDHIVYLPRFGAHAMAGVTCGAKNAVGWLRDDARKHLHQRAGSFFEQIAEINHAPPLRNKLRLVVTLGTQAILNIGPDFGAKYDFDGSVALAANNLIDHDALAMALIHWLDEEDLSVFDVYRIYPNNVDFLNRRLVENVWGKQSMDQYQTLEGFHLAQGLAYDPCLSRLAVLEGRRRTKIDVQRFGELVPERLTQYLRQYDSGLFSV